jgi:aspartyl protease family protein
MRLRPFIVVLIWLILLAITVWLFNRLLHPNRADNISQTSVVELERDPQGHYRAEVFINGVKVPAMVDTGATGVAISQPLAQQLHLQSNAAVRANTANGVSIGYAVRLDSVRLGGIQANNVSAVIVPELGDEILLGMSFLGRMDIRLFQGKMTIRQPAE